MEGGGANNGSWLQPGASNDLLMFDTTIDLELVAALENFIQPAAQPSSQHPHQPAAMPSTSYAVSAQRVPSSFPTPPGAYRNGFNTINTAYATNHSSTGFAGHKPDADRMAALERQRAEWEQQKAEDAAAGELGRDAVADSAAVDDAAEDVYVMYEPHHLKEGKPHPDHVVETTALAGVNPPPVKYEHHLQDIIKAGTLSNLQLESVVYSFQRFEGPRLPSGARQGFFLGDGTGVGKGRQIAATVLEHQRVGGKRALWVSVSTDLKFDAERDLRDLGAKKLPTVFPKGHTSIPTGKLSTKNGYGDGLLFVTYSLLVAGGASKKRMLEAMAAGEKAGAANSASEAMLAAGSRLAQIRDWLLGGDDVPLIVFDECHKAKNLLTSKGSTSKTALAVVAIQEALPEARVLYCSATGAAAMQNLGYMTRLGTWGFDSFLDFKASIENAGMGAMEMFSMGLKATGAYCSRALSYKGAEFELKSVELEQTFRDHYDRSTEMWQLLLRVFQYIECMVPGGRSKSSHFWSSHMRFFRQMLISAKVPAVARMVKEAVNEQDRCVVIGLQSTGESNIAQARADLEEDEELDDFVSAPKMVLLNLIEKQFPSQSNSKGHSPFFDSMLVQLFHCVQAWQELKNSQGEKSAVDASAAAAAPSVADRDDDIVFLSEKSSRDVDREMVQRNLRTGLGVDPNVEVPYADLQLADAFMTQHIANKNSKQSVTASLPARVPAELHAARAMEAPSTAATAGGYVGRSMRAQVKGSWCVGYVESWSAARRKYSIRYKPRAGSKGGCATFSEADLEPLLLEPAPGVGTATGKAAAAAVTMVGSNDEAAEASNGTRGGETPEVIELDDSGEEATEPTSKRRKGAAQTVKQEEDANTLYMTKRLTQIKELLCMAVECLTLPHNPLDVLTEMLGGPSEVAEMTGRAGGLVRREDGTVEYVRRCEGVSLKMMNITEREAFMSGKKLIAIISEAASTGISLQADRRVKNRRRRLHITLELPWSAEKALQQFGRSHRSNQTSAPVYRLLVTACGGERRFASSAASRLQTLGAILKGDRRALGPGADLKSFDVDNSYGHQALARMYSDLSLLTQPMAGVVPPTLTNGHNFFSHSRRVLQSVGVTVPHKAPVAATERGRVDRFLNRLLGLSIKDQAMLFEYFHDTYEAVVAACKRGGTFDDGIVALRAESITVVPGYPQAIHTDPQSDAVTSTLKLLLDRGVSFESASNQLAKELAELEGSSVDAPSSGFYLATFNSSFNGEKRPLVLLGIEMTRVNQRNERKMKVVRPHNGTSAPMWLKHLLKSYRKVTPAEAQPIWEAWYCDLEHENFSKRSYGARKSQVSLVVGAVLPIWKHLCDARTMALSGISSRKAAASKLMRVVQANLDDDTRVIGLRVEDTHLPILERVCQMAKADAERAVAMGLVGAGAMGAGATGGDEIELSFGDLEMQLGMQQHQPMFLDLQ